MSKKKLVYLLVYKGIQFLGGLLTIKTMVFAYLPLFDTNILLCFVSLWRHYIKNREKNVHWRLPWTLFTQHSILFVVWKQNNKNFAHTHTYIYAAYRCNTNTDFLIDENGVWQMSLLCIGISTILFGSLH